MRRRSISGQKRDREVKPLRDQYRKAFPMCQYPGCTRRGQDVHEIARGSSRQLAIGHRSCLLHLCRLHHEWMDDASRYPVSLQLRFKQMADPDGYDRQEVNVIRGRDPDAITQSEVDLWGVG